MFTISLAGKLALVTGGSRGIGRGIALELARAGADVIINYRANAEAAAQTVKDIEALGRKGYALPANMGNPDDIAAMFKAITEQSGGLDILILNAATGRKSPAAEMPLKAINMVMGVNLLGPWLCVEAALPLMKARGGGRIVALTSPGTQHVLPEYSVVAASKGALDVLVRYLAVELAPHNITVNAVAPGMVMTDAVAYLTNDDLVQRTLARTPLGRAVKVEEVGYLTTFLCSDMAAMICGEIIGIDGGWLLSEV